MADDLQLLFLDHKAPISGSQLEDLVSMVCKAFVTSNTSLGLAQEIIDEDLGDPMVAGALVGGMVKSEDAFAVTDSSGKIVGVSFVDVHAPDVARLGPVASAIPGAGRKTFVAACDYAEKLGFKTLVLTQSAANVRSFSLFSKVGFKVKHTCCYFGGFLPDSDLPRPSLDAGGLTVTAMTPSDVKECASLFLAAYGTDNGWNGEPDISGTLGSGTPFAKLVARGVDGEIVGYTTGFFIVGQTVAISQDVFVAMFAEASRLHQEMGLPPLRFHCPTEYPGLMAWAFENKLTLFRARNVMARGAYMHAWPNTGHIVTPSILGG